VTRPSLSQAEAWRPDSLRRLADGWDDAARKLAAHVDAVMREIRRSHEFWTGAAADAARDNARGIAAAGDDAARHLVIASVAARNGADQITAAQSSVQTRSLKSSTADSTSRMTAQCRFAPARRPCSSRCPAATPPSRATC